MAASAFLVKLPLKGGMTLKGGNDSVIVWALDAASAKGMASMAMSNDVPLAAWADATVTALVTGTEMEGWTYTVNLRDPVTPFTEISVSHVATTGQDVDDIGDALVVLLNATSSIAGAAYATPALKIAETTDGIGDWYAEVLVKPPGALYSTSLVISGDTANVDAVAAGFADTLVSEGAAGAAITVNLAVMLPALYALAKVDRG